MSTLNTESTVLQITHISHYRYFAQCACEQLVVKCIDLHTCNSGRGQEGGDGVEFGGVGMSCGHQIARTNDRQFAFRSDSSGIRCTRIWANTPYAKLEVKKADCNSLYV